MTDLEKDDTSRDLIGCLPGIGDEVGAFLLLTIHGMARRKGHTIGEDALRFEWMAVEVEKLRTEPPLRRAARRLFADQEREVLKRLPEVLGPHMPREKQLNFVAALFDTNRWREITRRLFEPLIKAVAARGFDIGMLRVGVSGVDFTSDTPATRRALDAVISRTLGINDTTADALARTVQTALVEGENLGQITLRVKELFSDAKIRRAETIARTTATSAFEAGQQSAFEDAGIERKRWLSQRDARVRPTHTQADGQEVGVQELFIVGGFMMRHPGDAESGAPPEEIVRCRCTSLPVTSDEGSL